MRFLCKVSSSLNFSRSQRRMLCSITIDSVTLHRRLRGDRPTDAATAAVARLCPCHFIVVLRPFISGSPIKTFDLQYHLACPLCFCFRSSRTRLTTSIIMTVGNIRSSWTHCIAEEKYRFRAIPYRIVQPFTHAMRTLFWEIGS